MNPKAAPRFRSAFASVLVALLGLLYSPSKVSALEPRVVGGCNTPGFAYGVDIAGNYAFVADLERGLQIIDVSDPKSMRIVGSYNPPGGGNSWRVAVRKNIAYLADGSYGLKTIDVSDVTRPRLLGQYGDTGDFLALDYPFAYVPGPLGTLFEIINVENPTSLQKIGSYTNDDGDFLKGIAVANGKAFLARNYGGLEIVNVSAPTRPTLLSRYPGANWYGSGITLHSHYALFGDASSIRSFDVSDPSRPDLIASTWWPSSNCSRS